MAFDGQLSRCRPAPQRNRCRLLTEPRLHLLESAAWYATILGISTDASR
jgi:hypothetical protein